MSATERHRLRLEAAALEVRAMRLRAGGNADDRWEAVCMLRDAAAKEIAALDAAEERSPDVEAAGRAEACHMFLLARDPLRALDQWAKIPREPALSGASAERVAALEPLFGEAIADLMRAWRDVLGESPKGAPATLRPDQLRALLGTFPGIAELWWGLSRCTASAGEAEMARARAARLEPSTASDAAGQAAWDSVAPALRCKVRVELSAERRGRRLSLESTGRILAAFAELLDDLAGTLDERAIEIAPSGAAACAGTFTLEITADGLHPFALEQLDAQLGTSEGHASAKAALRFVSLLAAHRVRFVAALVSPAVQRGVMLDEARRRALLPLLTAAARRSLGSRDVPQADDIARVLRLVEQIVRHGEDGGEVTPGQSASYRRAAKILGLLTEQDEPTPAGRLIARLGPEERLAVGVVCFESSACGDAWIGHFRGRTLLDVAPETAAELLRASAPGLAPDTVERRGRTLAAWHRALREHHYQGRGSAEGGTRES